MKTVRGRDNTQAAAMEALIKLLQADDQYTYYIHRDDNNEITALSFFDDSTKPKVRAVSLLVFGFLIYTH
jgi:hypothetical protein